MFNITLDLGGTHTKIGLIREGKLLAYSKVASNSHKGLLPLLPLIKEKVDMLLLEQGMDRGMVGGVGVAFPGIVNNVRKKVLSTNAKFDDALGVDIEQWVQQVWHTDNFCIDNDSRLATIGEWKRGIGQGIDNIVMMTIGTGIGTGVIIKGEPLYGEHYVAGSLGGHLVVDYRGRKCSCGNIGCVESHSSAFFLPEIIAQGQGLSREFKGDPSLHNFKTIFELADAGNADAVRVRNSCMDVWSAAIVSYIHAYDPAVVIMGGGVMNSKHVILPYVRERVGALAWCPTHTVRIEASLLENQAALYGLDYCLNHKL